jgi:hypothetical protein
MWAKESEGRICNSLPYFGSHGGPVTSDPLAETALTDAWNERASDPGTLASTMVENPFLDHDFPQPIHELTDERIGMVTPLARSEGEDALMALISPEARHNVRVAARRGVSVQLDSSAIADVCEIHLETMDALGAPAKSRSFLEAIPAHLRAGEGFDIWTARVEGEVAAALLVVRFNGVSEYFASGTRAGYRGHNPHAAVIFAALVHEARNGARIWDWGGTHLGMDGVLHFKRKWGSREGRYRYFVHLNDRSLLGASPDELVERCPGFYMVPFSALDRTHADAVGNPRNERA